MTHDPNMPPSNPPAQHLGYGGYGGPGGSKPKGMAVTALVTGIVGITFGLIGMCIPGIGCIAFICAVLAIIFGAIGLSKANKGLADGKGMAVTGLVLGIASMVLFLIAMILAMIYGFAVAAEAGNGYDDGFGDDSGFMLDE